MSECIFCRIVQGEIPCGKVYEDENVLAFRDINPQAAVHVLVIPKRHIASLAEAKPDDAAALAALMQAIPRLIEQLGLAEGFRTIINTGRHGGQEVYHLHMHILGGQQLPAMLKY